MEVKNSSLERQRSLLRIVAIGLILLLMAGCKDVAAPADSAGNQELQQEEITRYDGEMSQVISYVYTVKKELALTFNGMADRKTMEELLNELDHYGLKATFFVPGMRVAEEPDIAQLILDRGHELENNTLNRLDVSKLSYEQVYKEIQLANEVIERETGITPHYVRTRSGDVTDDLRLAAAQLGMEVVSYNINPKDRDMKDAKAIGEYIGRFMTRGGVITLNTDINPAVVGSIAYLTQEADKIGYKLVPLGQMIADGDVRKPLEQIPGYDAAVMNPDYEDASYEMIYNLENSNNQVVLTFDDWGSDWTVNTTLDILEEYDVEATFFLIGSGVENNPNLARAIRDAGHDVANHTYSHKVVTTLTPEELQEEVVKSHRAITEAIQEQPLMLLRPPTGAVDERTAKIIAATGYKTLAMYNVTAFDWDESFSAEDITNTIMNNSKNGSIILLHILNDKNTLEALPMIITGLRDKGYTFAKMSELMNQ